MKHAKIWYPFLKEKSEEDHISFYNPKNFSWATDFEKEGATVTAEITQFIETNENNIKQYFNKALVSPTSKWRTAGFFFWKWKYKNNIKQCPKTMKLLKSIPGVLSASISILEPGTTIKPHRGDTNATIRCHFPIQVPASLPSCGFKVNYEERSWEEGSLLLFNDAARHTAWNHTNKRRFVLLFDVIRPEFAHKQFQISSMVFSEIIIQSLSLKIPILKKIPKSILNPTRYFIATCLNPIIRLNAF